MFVLSKITDVVLLEVEKSTNTSNRLEVANVGSGVLPVVLVTQRSLSDFVPVAGSHLALDLGVSPVLKLLTLCFSK